MESGADVGADVPGNNKQPLEAAGVAVAAVEQVIPNNEVRGLVTERPRDRSW